MFSGGVELEVAEYFSGFDVDDQDVQVVDDHSDACSCTFQDDSNMVKLGCDLSQRKFRILVLIFGLNERLVSCDVPILMRCE